MPSRVIRMNAKPLTVITTHANADYDAMASMLAAQKLYPGAVVVFPGSQERGLRNFFVNSVAYLFNMVDIKDIDFDQVDRLVLVDTRQPDRIGPFKEIVNREGIDIHVYDHHPPAANDIGGSVELTQRTGANVTILVELIKKRKVPLTEDEATVLCMGIYEDTGSFTFASTTEKDFQAAAFLLAKGANLNVIADLMTREISPEQIALLNDMIQSGQHVDVNGVDIVVCSISREHYVPDFAFLVHKMVRMENIDAIFAIARMGSKVYIVARSRIPEVDVGAALTPLGGGGHSYAAAATIRDLTLAQTEQRLIEMLYRKIRSRRRAEELMSAPAISVVAEMTCSEASRMLTRYNINALLVTDRQEGTDALLGYISRQVIEKALFHKLAHVPVRDYMTTEMETVSRDADLDEIQEKIIENKQRLLPVMDGQTVCGVITRTDLLNSLVRRSRYLSGGVQDPSSPSGSVRTRNIKRFMTERLSRETLATLRAIGEVAEEIKVQAYVVGGFVRDLFLYRPNEDIDIVIEGDGIAFAKTFAARLGARIHAHAKFGTAVIIRENGPNIDVASARMEYYQFPAALPTVEMSSIKLDLFRRDFTINTLSIQLNPGRFGTLIDFFIAQKDLKERSLRVLHNLSFVEDPTRVFRAIRFEQRFGFTIGKLTASLIENAVRMDFFKRLSGRRVFAELRLIFEEQDPTASIVRLNDYGLLEVIHPSVSLDRRLVGLLQSIHNVTTWYDLLFLEESYMKWAVYFLALTRQCNHETTIEICDRFELPPRHRGLFCRERFAADKALKSLERERRLRNSTLVRRLKAFRTELVLLMMATTTKDHLKKSISQYFTKLRFVSPAISGKDLLELGLTPGPIYRRILDTVADGRLNGELKTREQELAFVKRYLVEENGS
jgi:tRNA nucleotidyltransferase (CCA-adding enzyme)